MFVVFDIGGTKMRVAALADGNNLSEAIIAPTPQVFEAGLATLVEMINKVGGGGKIEGISGGVAGPLDKDRSALLRAPNIGDWAGRPLKESLEKEFNIPVFLQNDAALAGLGEAMRGAGRGALIVAYITVGTGLGGARIVDGKIDRATIGFEPGHQIIDLDQSSCPDCENGSLEALVSGHDLEKRFGQKPEFLNDEKLWRDLARWLAIGLNNTIVHWSPDVVVLGGPMILGSPRIEVSLVAEELKRILKIYPELPEIKKAELGDLGGLYGALEYLRQNLTK